MKDRFIPFSKTLSLRLAIGLSVVFLAADILAGLYSGRIISDNAWKHSAAELDKAVLQIEQKLSYVEALLQGTSQLLAEPQTEENLYEITVRTVEESEVVLGSAIAFPPYSFDGKKYFSPYSYTDEGGCLHSKNLGTEEYNYSVKEWFKCPYETKKPHWTNPYFDEGGAEKMMSTFSFPVIGGDGNVLSILTADVSLEWLSDILLNVKPYPNSTIRLLTADGEEICSDSSTAAVANDEGSKRDIILAENLSNGWSMHLSCLKSDIYKDLKRMRLILTILGLLGVFLVSWLANHMVRRRTAPLSKISDAARQIAKGDFNVPLPQIQENNEIRQLKDSISYMQSSLTTYMENLKETTAINEKYSGELQLASSIQMAMLSHDFPKMDNLDIYADSKPAKHVGGDLYDFAVRGDKLYFTVGDVSGKGVPASLVMALTLASFRMASSLDAGPDVIMSIINDSITERNETQLFVTLFIGILDLRTLKLDFCNAGHNSIIINGNYIDEKPNLVTGVMKGFAFESQSMQLRKGDRIILYSDGVVEAEDDDKALFGEERLLDLVNGCTPGETAKVTAERIFDAVDSHLGHLGRNDDVTVMTLNI